MDRQTDRHKDMVIPEYAYINRGIKKNNFCVKFTKSMMFAKFNALVFEHSAKMYLPELDRCPGPTCRAQVTMTWHEECNRV